MASIYMTAMSRKSDDSDDDKSIGLDEIVRASEQGKRDSLSRQSSSSSSFRQPDDSPDDVLQPNVRILSPPPQTRKKMATAAVGEEPEDNISRQSSSTSLRMPDDSPDDIIQSNLRILSASLGTTKKTPKKTVRADAEETISRQSSSSSLRMPDDSPDDMIQPNMRVLSPSPVTTKKRPKNVVCEEAHEQVVVHLPKCAEHPDEEAATSLLSKHFDMSGATTTYASDMPKQEFEDSPNAKEKDWTGIRGQVHDCEESCTSDDTFFTCKGCSDHQVEQDKEQSSIPRARCHRELKEIENRHQAYEREVLSASTSLCDKVQSNQHEHDKEQCSSPMAPYQESSVRNPRTVAETRLSRETSSRPYQYQHRMCRCTFCTPLNFIRNSASTTASADHDENDFPGAIAIKPNYPGRVISQAEERMMAPLISTDDHGPPVVADSWSDPSFLLVSAHIVADSDDFDVNDDEEEKEETSASSYDYDEDDTEDEDRDALGVEDEEDVEEAQWRPPSPQRTCSCRSSDQIRQEILRQAVDATEITTEKRWLYHIKTWILCWILCALVLCLVLISIFCR